MKVVTVTDLPPLTDDQLAQLRASDGREPDTGDIPEAPAANWRDVRRFPVTQVQPGTVQIDADLLDWLERKHAHYQAEVNRILRRAMEADLAR